MKTSLIVLFTMIAGFVLMNVFDYVSAPKKATNTHSSHSPNNVILYATESCGYCKQAKNLFAQKNVTYVECDVNKSAKCHKEFKVMNGRGVPVFNIKGEILHGYNQELLLATLKSKNIAFN